MSYVLWTLGGVVVVAFVIAVVAGAWLLLTDLDDEDGAEW